MAIPVGGGGSVYPFPAPPRPLTDEGHVSAVSNRIPHKGTLVNSVKAPSVFGVADTGSWEGYLGETLVWSVGPDDVDAACNGFAGIQACNYDSVNDRLYVMGLNTGTAPDTYYFAYITLETGAVTVLNAGGTQLTADFSGVTSNLRLSISRSAVDSGDFTVSADNRVVVVDEATGAELSSVVNPTTYTAGMSVGTYATLDGTVELYRNVQDSTETAGSLEVVKNAQMIKVPSPQPLFSTVITGLTQNALPWGDKVKVLSSTTTTTNAGILRTFNRTAFDQWLQDVARLGGVA